MKNMNKEGCKSLAMQVIIHAYKEGDFDFFSSPVYQFYAEIAEVENIPVEEIHFSDNKRKILFETHSYEELVKILHTADANIRKEAYRNGWTIGKRKPISFTFTKEESVCFWNNVKKLCRKENFTQADLAERIGINVHSLTGMIYKGANPKIKTAEKIASVFGIKTEELLTA